jgi:ribose 5-phosphate isomerase B
VRIVFGTDSDNALTRAVLDALEERGHEVKQVAVGEEWPEVGRAVARAVVSGEAERGVVCCWTGTGVTIAANKVVGARAALCTDAATATGARRWNDANVLSFGLRLTSEDVAREMLDAFLSTEPDESELPTISRIEAQS